MDLARLFAKLPSAVRVRTRSLIGKVISQGAIQSEALTRQHIVWAYRILLDREPESETIISDFLAECATTQELRAHIMTSREFRLRNPGDFPYLSERGIVITELDHGLKLFVELSDLAIGAKIVRGCYEQSEIDFVRRTVQPGQNVLDLGANIGFYTITMASLVGPSGRVYAFEPVERTADLLQRSVAENGFQNRVTLARGAVGQAPGSARLLVAQNTLSSGGSYLLDHDIEIPDGHAIVEVEVIALDDYALRRPISFIKMDIEGAEPLALHGARALLRADRPIVLSEINAVALQRVSARTPAQFIAEMETCGYDCHLLEAKGPTRIISDLTDPPVASVVFFPRGH